IAQFESADVLGTVSDNSRAVMSKASVTLTNEQTGLEAKSITNENGEFTFSNVKIGTYSLAAEAPGFSKAVAKGIIVNVNARQRVDLVLQVGTVTESIDVIGAAAVLQTDSSERGQLIAGRSIVELPLNGRAYSDLALLTIGVLRSPSAFSSTPREGSFIVNGLRATYNNFLLDGIDNNAYGTSNQGFANQVAQPSPDSVAEFKVITNNYSAEYGRSGGATIDVALKSGTNLFHGTGYDYVRNTDLNAIGYIFGARPATFKKPTLQQNQFGATVGGPAIKNRVFFFGDYEGFRAIAHTLKFATIPSSTDRQGILPVAVRNPQTGATYAAGTQIPLTAFARKVLNDLPAPTGLGRSNNFQALPLDRNYNDKFDAKVDAQIRQNLQSFLRISQRKVNIFNEPTIPGLSGGNSNGFTRVLNQQGSGGATWIVTPRSILEARFGVSRTVAGKFPPLSGGPSMLALYGITGLPTSGDLIGGLTATTISGFDQLGRQSTNPQFQNPLSFDWKVNFAQTMGKQSLKVGYEFVAIRTQVNDINPLYGRDAYAGGFSKPAGGPADSASYSLADFYFGLRSQYALANYVVGNYRQHENFWYVQDDIRVTPKLTVNLGLRYEYATPRWERDNVLSNFDPATNTILQAKSGSIYDRALVNPDRNNFAPRIGFAYSVIPKTVIRGGYGWSYIHQNRVGSADLLGINYPQVVIATINQTNPLDPNFVTTQQGYPAGLTNAKNFSVLNANIAYIPKDIKTPYVQSWTFSVQRELTNDLVLDVGYVGNHSVALPVIADYNQAFPQPTATSALSLNARRPIAGYGGITWLDPAGFSNYNALQVKVEKRLSAGFSFLNSFVWSKAIDNSSQSLDAAGGNEPSPQNVRNMASEKGLSAYDQKLTDVLSVFYQVPFGRERKFGSKMNRYADSVVGGWELSVVNTALSAPPLTLRAWNGSIPASFQTVGNLATFRGGEAFRPNISGPVLAINPADITNTFFNTANVSLPTDPSNPFGNAGRNTVRGFPIHQMDVGVHKNFTLPREGMYLQFRAEFFNLLNHTNFLPPNTDRNSGAFGTTRSTLAPRQVQLALKLVF
ncbi:MAG: carboxypeptidase regulatory-like domain-containing protein, partial [Bryobacteraceae bacterium]